jgi:hypothetical protein
VCTRQLSYNYTTNNTFVTFIVRDEPRHSSSSTNNLDIMTSHHSANDSSDDNVTSTTHAFTVTVSVPTNGQNAHPTITIVPKGRLNRQLVGNVNDGPLIAPFCDSCDNCGRCVTRRCANKGFVVQCDGYQRYFCTYDCNELMHCDEGNCDFGFCSRRDCTRQLLNHADHK